METLWIYVCLSAFLNYCVFCEGDNVGAGLWNVINISPCDLSEDNIIQTNVTKTKISRAQDGFTGSLDLGVDLTDSLALNADICKIVDGGCKPFMVMKDDSFCGFMRTYMLEFFEELLKVWGIDPPDCPVKKGIYTVSEYPFNYRRLKKEAVYGTFETIATVLHEQTEVLCLKVIASFTKEDDGDEDDE